MIKITFPDGTEAEVKTATDATRLLKQFDEGLDPDAEHSRENWKIFDRELKNRLEAYERKNDEIRMNSDAMPHGGYCGSIFALTTYIRGLCKLRAAVSGVPVTNYGGRHTSEELDFFMQIIDQILPSIKD